MAIANAAVVGGDEVKVAASPRAVEAGDNAETKTAVDKPAWMMEEDEDDGLTEEQRRLIAERVAALQNRFKKFEEKTTKEKIDELMLGNSDKNLTEREAEMVLRVCNGTSSRRAIDFRKLKMENRS